MIESTFLFLDRVSARTHDSLHRQGIYNWDDFLRCPSIKGISSSRKLHYDREIRKQRRLLYDGEPGCICQSLPRSEHWRLYDLFKDECVFIDIEVSGVSRQSYVFMIGLFDGSETKIMIRDINLDFRLLKQQLARYKMVISFNGSVHDLPFLQKRYPGLLPAFAQVDLRFLCRRAGLAGGLKKIEVDLGIRRNKILERMHGGDVLRLWRMYKATGDEYYLNLLVEYNEDDVMNLKAIFEKVIKRLMATESASRQAVPCDQDDAPCI